MKVIHDEIILESQIKYPKKKLIIPFDFPDEIKTACKQYLIYFSQFLADLGINAKTNLREETEKVLFEVIPEDGEEAIQNIRNALDIYLTGASHPEMINSSNLISNEDIAIREWRAQISFLNMQLELAKAQLLLKDATIESLMITNYQYRNIINESSGQEDEEKVIGEILTVTKYKGKGFKINFPEIFRLLKRKLKKK